MNLNLNLVGELMDTLGKTSCNGGSFRTKIDITDKFIFLQITKLADNGDTLMGIDKTYPIDAANEPSFMFHEVTRLAAKLVKKGEKYVRV